MDENWVKTLSVSDKFPGVMDKNWIKTEIHFGL